MAEFMTSTDKTVAVLVAPGLEEVEALAPVDICYRAGIATDLISITDSLTVTGSHQLVLTCAHTLAAVDTSAYDLLFLPGGMPGTTHLKADVRVQQILAQRLRAGQDIAAICAAPSILAESGLLTGKQATANPNFVSVLAQHGAQVSAERVVTDGNLITSQGLGTAVDLGVEIVRRYCGDAAAAAVKAQIVYPD